MLSGVLTLLLVALFSSVQTVSKRKLKEPVKQTEQPAHLAMSYEEIKKDMFNFKYKDFAEAATGHRRILVLYISNRDAEGLRAFRGYYGAYLRLRQKELNITWGYVDCDDEPVMCHQEQIFYTPQYWLHIAKRKVNYTAGRSSYLVSDWVHKTISYPGHFIDRRSQLKKYEDSQDRFFFYIGFMDTDYEIYKEIAASIPYYTWISCFDRDRMMHANGIYWYDQREKAQDMRNGPHGENVMLNFTLKYFNLLRTMSDFTMDRIFIHDQAALVLFYPDTNEERGIQMPFWSAAMDIKWEMLCAQIAIHDPEDNPRVQTLMDITGVTNPQSSAVRIIRLKDGKWEVYQMRERINHGSLLNFWNDFKQGKLKQFYKSGKPVEHRANEVRTLVTKNHQKYAFNPEHDVVVIYHTPNCTLCDRIIKLGQIAVQILSRYEDVVIAKLDTWYNAGEVIPDRNIPQVRLYKKNDKQHPVVFTGLYTAKDMIAWICEQIGKHNPYEEEVNAKLKNRREQKNPQEDI